MKRTTFILLAIFSTSALSADEFTDFYCNAADTTTTYANNLNAGSTSGTTTYIVINGTWTAATKEFETSTNPIGTVNVGDFASVYEMSVTTGTKFIARVTIVTSTGIRLSDTAFSGSTPTIASGLAGLRVGGAWQGPNGVRIFPFNFITNSLVNTSGHFPFVNFKNGATYYLSAAGTHQNSRISFGGYTSTPRDGGKAIIASTATTSFVLFNNSSGDGVSINDFILDGDSFTSGTSNNVTLAGSGSMAYNIATINARGNGLTLSGDGAGGIGVEAYKNNKSNTSASGGIALTGAGSFCINCYSHHNDLNANSSGFVGPTTSGNSAFLVNSIGSANGQYGVNARNRSAVFVALNNDFYDNDSSGIGINATTSPGSFVVRNNNSCFNGGYGIEKVDALNDNVIFENNGFCTGTKANTSGTVESGFIGREIGSINYPADVTPWQDPDNGNFKITLPHAKSTGAGTFTQSQLSSPLTVGYPDIGAAQSYPLNAGSFGVSQ